MYDCLLLAPLDFKEYAEHLEIYNVMYITSRGIN